MQEAMPEYFVLRLLCLNHTLGFRMGGKSWAVVRYNTENKGPLPAPYSKIPSYLNDWKRAKPSRPRYG
jgi:hypothetical protein